MSNVNMFLGKIKKYIKNNKTEIIATLLFVIPMFVLVLLPVHNRDTYTTFNMGFSSAAKDMATRNGRPVIALFYYISGKLNLSMNWFSVLSGALAIFWTIASILVLSFALKKERFKERTKNKTITCFDHVYISDR